MDNHSCSAVSQFLSGLPSKNPDNFQKWSSDGPRQNVTRRPTSYVPTKDFPPQQVIVTEKTNILLRYLHQQFNKKSAKPQGRNLSGSTEDEVARKRPRISDR